MSYPTYLVHFNKNHDPKNGQFTFGDGDGDGINDDHAHRSGSNSSVAKRVVSNFFHPVRSVKTVYRVKKENSLDYKRNVDTTIRKGSSLQTLSTDSERTKSGDMFYASHKPVDNKVYAFILRNRLNPEQVEDDGEKIGTGFCIKTTATSDIKVASEKTGAEHFINLYRNNKDFRDYVNNPDRMANNVESDFAYKFKGYKDAKSVLDKFSSKKDYNPSDEELYTVYRLFNYQLPYRDENNAKSTNDATKQRARFFNSLKKDGYGACLDTNDAIYNKVKATSPVIVFDMESVVTDDVREISADDSRSGYWAQVGRTFLGI